MQEILFTKEDCPNCSVHAPKEAYFYFPSFEKQIKYDEKDPENSCRFIFEKKNKREFLPHENDYFDKFMEYIEENHKEDLILPNDWTEGETRKFLQAADFNFEDTIEQMKTKINMNIPSYPFDYISEILASGFVYMHGLDINYRPILVCSVSNFMEYIDKYELDHFICAINIFANYLLKHIFIPGQVENWIIITDLKGVSIFKPPTKMISIFNFLQKRFYYRLAKLYVYGMSGILNFCWNIVKNLVNETTTGKFVFISNENDIHNTILSHVHPSQLEEKYGGTSQNVDFPLSFPFILPSDEYQIDDSNNNQIISKEEYIKFIGTDKLSVISPYIDAEIRININLSQNLQKSKIFRGKNSSITNNVSTMNSNEFFVVKNNTEFYECNSNLENDNEEIQINYDDKDFITKSEILKSKNREEIKDIGISKSNTTFESNENKINCCQCSSVCSIF